MAHEEILPEDAWTRAQTGGWRLVDVRTPQEFAMGHPEGAINVPIGFRSPMGLQPNSDFVPTIRRLFPDMTAPIALTCGNGPRSDRGCMQLSAAGYTRLANVLGGMFGAPGLAGWIDSGLPVSAETAGVSWDDIKG